MRTHTNSRVPQSLLSSRVPGAEQKVLPDRQVCELVDRYYGGWKQTNGYKALKQSIR